VLSTDSKPEPGVLGLGSFHSLLKQEIHGKDFTFNWCCFARSIFFPEIL